VLDSCIDNYAKLVTFKRLIINLLNGFNINAEKHIYSSINKLYAMLKKPTAQIAHLVFADTLKNQKSYFFANATNYIIFNANTIT
jgi:hypothetical protein